MASRDRPRGNPCAVTGCVKPRHTKGYCQGHAARLARGLDPHHGPPLGKGKSKYLGLVCKAGGCNDDARVLGFCKLHYRRHYDGLPLSHPYGSMLYGNLWKQIQYVTAHKRCRDLWGPADRYDCTKCGKKAREWAYDGTDPSEIYGPCGNGAKPMSKTRYSRFPEFYKPMCLRCHRGQDKNLAAQELEEYREWKHKTGLTLKDIHLTTAGSEGS